MKTQTHNQLRFGTCCAPQNLAWNGSLENSPQFLENIGALKNAGAQYLEFPVVSTQPEGEARDWENLRAAIDQAPLKVEAFNVFIPGHHRITGPEVNLPRVLEYCRVALSRCKQLGGESVVLGSGGARKVPEGFDMEKAREQFVEFCRALGAIAAENNITICIEPLNTNEDNLVTSVAQGAQIVDKTAHPNIQVLADSYHMWLEDEPMQNILDAGARLRHTHVSAFDRYAPGFSQSDSQTDYDGFFRALHEANYDVSTHAARCSFECIAPDLLLQAPQMFAFIQSRYEHAIA